MNKFGKIYKWSKNRGTLWTALYAFRWVLLKHIDFVEKYLINNLEKSLINIEKRRFLTGNGTICSLYHTTGKNRKIWNSYNWAKRGEEWTSDVKRYKELDPDYWKISVINKMMLKYIKKGSTILEVGPGGGSLDKGIISSS